MEEGKTLKNFPWGHLKGIHFYSLTAFLNRKKSNELTHQTLSWQVNSEVDLSFSFSLPLWFEVLLKSLPWTQSCYILSLLPVKWALSFLLLKISSFTLKGTLNTHYQAFVNILCFAFPGKPLLFIYPETLTRDKKPRVVHFLKASIRDINQSESANNSHSTDIQMSEERGDENNEGRQSLVLLTLHQGFLLSSRESDLVWNLKGTESLRKKGNVLAWHIK